VAKVGIDICTGFRKHSEIRHKYTHWIKRDLAKFEIGYQEDLAKSDIELDSERSQSKNRGLENKISRIVRRLLTNGNTSNIWQGGPLWFRNSSASNQGFGGVCKHKLVILRGQNFRHHGPPLGGVEDRDPPIPQRPPNVQKSFARNSAGTIEGGARLARKT